MLAKSGGVSESWRGVCPEGDRGEPDGDWLVEPVAGKENFRDTYQAKNVSDFASREDLIQFIWEERRRELCFEEAMRFWDMRRQGCRGEA
ncbi:MAG: RagB/SusD family nutrient uptake outer membrane protein [Butyricimonas paravirosa]